MILLVKRFGVIRMCEQFMNALSDLGIFVRPEIGPHVAVEWRPRFQSIERAKSPGRRDRNHHSSLAQTLNGVQAHASRARCPLFPRGVIVERQHFFPGLAPVPAAEQGTWIRPGIYHARFIGGARLNVPDPLHGFVGNRFQLQAFIGQLPAPATISAGVNVRSEPGAVDGRVHSFGLARILRNVVHFPAAEVRAVDAPGFAVSRGKSECTLAGTDPKSQLRRGHSPILAGKVACRREYYFALRCFCCPTRILKCCCLASWNALWSWRATVSLRYLSTSAPLGRTTMTVKDSLHVGQNGRNRLTLGIAITI